MGRPNLSERITMLSQVRLANLLNWIHVTQERRRAKGTSPAEASFPMCFSRNTGGVDVSIRTLGIIFTGNLEKKTIPRRRSQGMPRPRQSETKVNYSWVQRRSERNLVTPVHMPS